MKSPLCITILSAGLAAAALADDLGYKDTPIIPGTKWHVHDSERPQPPVVTPGENATQEKASVPPSDATVLFNGKDMSNWRLANGQDAPWKVEDGVATVGGGDVFTKDEFGPDFQLHVEFAEPNPPQGKSQGRGNSGVFLFGRYEIQVLDNYENPTYPDGQATAIYGYMPPQVNACRKPGEWQTYDIIWESPRWDADGKLVKKAYVTVLLNGLLLHHRQELIGHTPYRAASNYNAKHPPKGYLELYYHSNPVRFRNMWIRPVETNLEP